MLPLALLLACASPSPDDSGGADAPVDYLAPGPHPVGRATVSLSSQGRALSVELWFPAQAATVGAPLPTLVADPEDRATYEALLDAAPKPCPTRVAGAGEGTPAAGPWPLVLLSHCHGCTRFSMLSAAEHLASHGMVVAAPDHAGNTLWDELAGQGLPLSTDTLALRVADLQAVRDAALAGDLGVQADPDRVGVAGHSFGAVTAGKLLQDEQGGQGGPLLGAFIGAPVDNPLLPGVDAALLGLPTLFLVLAEDHSIGQAGNTLMATNFEEVAGPSWLVEMADAGHWSPSDLVGLTEGFMPGCGEDTRQDGGEPFTYLEPARGRQLTGGVLAAFLAQGLGLDPRAGEWLAAQGGDELEILSP